MMWLMVCRTGMAFLTAGITAIRAKASLNAILLTDFIIGLEPLEGTQASA